MPSAPGSNIVVLRKPGADIGAGQPDEGLPGTGLAGLGGIESIIEYNGLLLNVRDWVDTYLVTQIGGLDDADIRDNREVNPGYHGEQAFQSYYGGRTITLTGKVFTKTLFKLRDMQQALRRAFADLDNEHPLIFHSGDPDYITMINCKKSQQIQMADEQRTANHFERPFQITLRASNPRFISSVIVYSTKIFSAATHNAIAFTPANNGNFNAQPQIELIGPIATGLVIQNEANGDWMSLTGAVPGGERWIIEGSTRRMYRASDGANRYQYLDVNSDWIELVPGNNSVRVTATGLTSGTSSVTFLHYHTFM